jgi:hypothetical protein
VRVKSDYDWCDGTLDVSPARLTAVPHLLAVVPDGVEAFYWIYTRELEPLDEEAAAFLVQVRLTP